MAEVNPSSEVQKLVKKLDVGQVTRTKSIFNQNQIQLLYRKTPQKHIYSRPGKGGGTWRYPKNYYIRQALNSLFGFDWSFEILTTLPEAMDVAKLTGTCVVQGKLTGRVVDDRGVLRDVVRMQFGRSEVKWVKGRSPDDVEGSGKLPKPVDFGNDMKAASTDALKKCASQLGIAADIYDADEFMEITIAESDDDKQKEAENKVRKAKRVLKKEAEKVGDENGGANRDSSDDKPRPAKASS